VVSAADRRDAGYCAPSPRPTRAGGRRATRGSPPARCRGGSRRSGRRARPRRPRSRGSHSPRGRGPRRPRGRRAPPATRRGWRRARAIRRWWCRSTRPRGSSGGSHAPPRGRDRSVERVSVPPPLVAPWRHDDLPEAVHAGRAASVRGRGARVDRLHVRPTGAAHERAGDVRARGLLRRAVLLPQGEVGRAGVAGVVDGAAIRPDSLVDVVGDHGFHGALVRHGLPLSGCC